ncbi:hypothetical protein TRFO_05572 [Tritrichomonas foetus]|uniref:Uncharacterized protein n=1 Tax=Tritrichomonas foetus TaxID=1144522 RepID=A0A1J4K4K5_9EUKA|nr:hypothetical protein TRFO_05572 [Tritrichomonas foetus]|eukprot:OHT06377.1 hypothetical protein TRFO_05572 [Tritrichomonas foetus]
MQAVFGEKINEMEDMLEKQIDAFTSYKEQVDQKCSEIKQKNENANLALQKINEQYDEQLKELQSMKGMCAELEEQLLDIENFLQQRPDQPATNQWLLHNSQGQNSQKFLKEYTESILQKIEETSRRLHERYKEEQITGQLQNI